MMPPSPGGQGTFTAGKSICFSAPVEIIAWSDVLFYYKHQQTLKTNKIGLHVIQFHALEHSQP